MKDQMKIAGALLAATSLPAVAATPAAKIAAAPAAAATTNANFSVFLPLRNKDALAKLLVDQQTAGSASYHKWLTPDQFNAQFGPTAGSIARVKSALTKAGLSITSTEGRAVHVAGTVGQVNKLFATSLRSVPAASGGPARLAVGKIAMPAALKSEGAVVLSFSGLPPKHAMVTPANAQRLTGPDNRVSTKGPYWYNDLKQAYDYPSYQSLDGTGVNVAILMSGALTDGDTALYFNNTFDTTRTPPRPPQNYTAVSGKAPPVPLTVKVDGGGVVNSQDGGDFEAALDVQQVLGGAPGASVTLISIPDLYDDHIIDGYNAIVAAKDSNNQAKYAIVNSSFGECELYYTAAYNSGHDYTFYLAEYEEIFQQGNAEGITFVASSGDNGGLECENVAGTKYIPGVSTPAVSNYVTGVGGTNLVTNYVLGSYNSTYVSENGYADPLASTSPSGGYFGAGGGISQLEPKPSYQSLVNTGSSTYRTVPDVGMTVGGCPTSAAKPCGTPRSSVYTVYEGGFYSVLGTSVASPEFVSALALYIQKTGQKQGNFNPYLYHFGATQTKVGGLNAPAAAAFFHRNIPGYDGVYTDTQPSSNYNYIIGNGTPDVRKLFGMTGLPAAGTPQTPSNP